MDAAEERAALGDGILYLMPSFDEPIASGCQCILFEQDGNWINDDPWEAAERAYKYVSENLVDKASL